MSRVREFSAHSPSDSSSSDSPPSDRFVLSEAIEIADVPPMKQVGAPFFPDSPSKGSSSKTGMFATVLPSEQPRSDSDLQDVSLEEGSSAKDNASKTLANENKVEKRRCCTPCCSIL